MTAPDRQRAVVPVLLVAVLLIGAAIRLPNLGGPDFDVDEILHVYPAQRLMAGEPPLLPSGERYDRALPFTTAIAWSGELFGGVDEWTARLPSVVFGCLAIGLVFLIGRRWYSNAAGLVAALVTAVAPMQVAFSREARMYALLQLLYLAIVFLLFEAFETAAPGGPRGVPGRLAEWARGLQMRPWLLLLAVPLGLLALQTHPLIAPAMAGPTAYVLCMGLVTPLMRSVPRRMAWKYGAAAALLLAGGAVVFAFDLGGVRGQYEMAVSYVPTWAQGDVSNWRFYAYRFAELYPVVFGTFLGSVLFALTRNWKATLYIVACFGVPFVLHTFLFAWKSDRYLFQVMPLMFVPFGVSVSSVVSFLYRGLVAWADTSVGLGSRPLAGMLTAAGVAFLVGASPELREGFRLHQSDVIQYVGVRHNSWQAAMRFIGERSGPGEVIVTSRALLSGYYGATLPQYFLNNDDLELMLAQDLRREDGTLIEYTAGAPLIVDLAGLREVVAAHPAGWFVTEQNRFESTSSFPPDVVEFVRDRFLAEPVPGAADMAVLHWSQPLAAAAQ